MQKGYVPTKELKALKAIVGFIIFLFDNFI